MIILVYAIFIFWKYDPVHSRALLAVAGCCSVGLSIGFAYGFSTGIGLKLNPVINVLPFILIGIGIDDMFVLVAALESESADLDPKVVLPLTLSLTLTLPLPLPLALPLALTLALALALALTLALTLASSRMGGCQLRWPRRHDRHLATTPTRSGWRVRWPRRACPSRSPPSPTRWPSC